MTRFYSSDPGTFADALDIARNEMPDQDRAQVSPVDPATAYRSFWLTADFSAGFAIDTDGTLVHLFKHPESPWPDVMTHALRFARALGATKLEAFDTYLVKAYAKRGARESARSPWVDRYAPSGWNVATMGRPDYVTMVL